ncbi:MAG TPA: transcription termination/antitermination protein NusA [Candidatus Yonathbacteria bacterium]|uniref:Transcription termination/antitermination protein NusA n=1 Tax=Candidatus Nomurabacteria bacterium GW2011_GWC2_42_20 TaxID=1618756 RepID=A0A0G0ZHM8_9BACT|nr:MAG: NusA antitermination factor [Candidatus Nomurabacteria bacterium GW2011_GWC2_42_20]KKS59342.1 MAG: NusA antitermination factor [Candidatus Nomurabacteria bacterium GW2011_GWA2_42_41]KKT09785.1 MAG: NusA antitermination factor [Candidatus Nomurabacteria bacterium GW2011_GWB1_43_20]TAN36098.1 MAG: transcription termination/antitermination protein NusA [Patescibacteria group bacterium]HBH71792.1 transcription termination/antitermination protein NusA [Candidatus Yonathbacteria bacterium]
MLDLKTLGSALEQLESERGIPRAKIIEAIEQALAAAYKKDFGKKGQIVRAVFDINSGKTEFIQVKIVVDEQAVRMPEDTDEEADAKEKALNANVSEGEEISLRRFSPEHDILLADARRIKRDAVSGDEVIFPLEAQEDYGRIAAQTAKQVIIQRIREAEKVSIVGEYGGKVGDIVQGSVQRMERGNIFVDLGKTTGLLAYEDQIPSERYKQGERISAYLYKVEETPRGIDVRLSRAHPKMIEKLFAQEAPEVATGTVQIKAVAREAGSRAKVAVASSDEHIDPIGSCVGQRGVRVSTVMSELGGEKIDLIVWSEDAKKFIEDSLSPAQVQSVVLDEEKHQATVAVSADQQSLAIGRGGQNVRLAAKLTGWKLDIVGLPGEIVAEATADGAVTIEKATPESADGSAEPLLEARLDAEGLRVVEEGANAPTDAE